MLIPELERLENVTIMQDNIDYEATNSAIVYPVEYGVESTYFPVSDLNWDGVLTDDEMAIQPGVYSREDLNELVKYIFGYSINDYLESTGNTDLIDENEDQTIPTTLDDELLEHITAGFDPSGTVTEDTSSELDTYGDQLRKKTWEHITIHLLIRKHPIIQIHIAILIVMKHRRHQSQRQYLKKVCWKRVKLTAPVTSEEPDRYAC